MSRREIWAIEVRHNAMGKYRHIKGSDPDVVKQIAIAQQKQWEDQWERQESKLHLAMGKQSMAADASRRTDEARALQEALATILHSTLTVDDTIDWTHLKDQSRFADPEPRLQLPVKPDPAQFPVEPKPTVKQFQAPIGFLDSLIPGMRSRKQAVFDVKFATARAQWESQCEAQKAALERAMAIWQKNTLETELIYRQAHAAWKAAGKEFLAKQVATNEAVDRHQAAYLAGDATAIVEYCEMVLANSQYPQGINGEWDLDYIAPTRTLIVDYQLPSPDELPTLTEVKYVAARNEFKEVHLSASAREARYDNVIYQITLRTLHELFEADQIKALDAVVFNGIVTARDRVTGAMATSCIVSVQATATKFALIDLAHVDPKACFKGLKGVGSAKLHGITAVAPIATINTADRRFVSAYGVADTLDDSTNLAAMDWEDFEHLVREVFGQEFASNGGEVKITQASRDGGVDAVAFDPDPIRGGKIVIQAKRYTNTVGVSAVRDLFGTVQHEGAIKGILICTSNYGPDAYEFAKGKPLTLLNGANLLHLLAKHGHKARIDLKEAKLIMQQNTAA